MILPNMQVYKGVWKGGCEPVIILVIDTSTNVI